MGHKQKHCKNISKTKLKFIEGIKLCIGFLYFNYNLFPLRIYLIVITTQTEVSEI